MFCFNQKIKEEAGYSLGELMTVISVLVVIVSAAYGLLNSGQKIYTVADDGFQAQYQARSVIFDLVKEVRQAQKLNVPGIPVAYADQKGRFFDLKMDVDHDDKLAIVRVEYNEPGQQVVMRIDRLSPNAKGIDRYNYDKDNDNPTKADYINFYDYSETTGSSTASDWDETKVLATKVVNKESATNWPPAKQTSGTDDPKVDNRLFTFYEDFDVPLDTVNDLTWLNKIYGIKIYILTDIRPAAIPSPFGVETNVNLRNVARNK